MNIHTCMKITIYTIVFHWKQILFRVLIWRFLLANVVWSNVDLIINVETTNKFSMGQKGQYGTSIQKFKKTGFDINFKFI